MAYIVLNTCLMFVTIKTSTEEKLLSILIIETLPFHTHCAAKARIGLAVRNVSLHSPTLYPSVRFVK